MPLATERHMDICEILRDCMVDTSVSVSDFVFRLNNQVTVPSYLTVKCLENNSCSGSHVMGSKFYKKKITTWNKKNDLPVGTLGKFVQVIYVVII